MDIRKLFASLFLCFSVAFLGSVVTLPSITTWYVGINKPEFTPPNWIFGPVWTLLYFLMAVSLYMVWRKVRKKKEKNRVLMIFFVQLLLNLIWSFVFFGLHLPLFGLLIIIALWVGIFLSIKAFSPISQAAAYLLLPYLLWVSFAAFLNLSIVVLN